MKKMKEIQRLLYEGDDERCNTDGAARHLYVTMLIGLSSRNAATLFVAC